MKSYLSLIPISAKAHRRQNRMTLMCIVFAVFLVTAVFGMADMGVRMEAARLTDKHGTQKLQELAAGTAAQTLYSTAGVLFILILVAGILMISGSINSNVAQRTSFFGMLRCIGMSSDQMKRFVRLEALNWCRVGIPIGILLGVVSTWGLCGILRFLVGGEFAMISIWGISPVGIGCGIVMGIVTVLAAANAPAQRAAKVSPTAAVSGNTDRQNRVRRSVDLRFLRLPASLGIQHALSSGKNLFLMIGSFALSIILFLSFTVLIEFVGYIMPQSSSTPDLTISSSDSSIDESLISEIKSMEGVKQVFGRRSMLNISAKIKDGKTPASPIDLISFDKYDLKCLQKDHLLVRGSDSSKVAENRGQVLIVQDKNIPLKIGDQILIRDKKLKIAGMLKFNPFTEDGSSDGKITVISSGDTFTRITGSSDYAMLIIQLNGNATNHTVAAIQKLTGTNETFHDVRDQKTARTYLAFMVFVYGFLVIITLVTVLSIMNHISMSVSSRMKQYGIMRAIGMDGGQIIKMITAEAFTYALAGSLTGCAIGLVVSGLLFKSLITTHFSYAVWEVPVIPLVMILLFVLFATGMAVYAPVKRIQRMVITETIHENN